MPQGRSQTIGHGGGAKGANRNIFKFLGKC